MITWASRSRSRSRIGQWIRSFLCVAMYGGHEFYRAWSSDRVYQVCVLCGHETRGWKLKG